MGDIDEHDQEVRMAAIAAPRRAAIGGFIGGFIGAILGALLMCLLHCFDK
jgi:predicted lipid-binding transport protein (Tim44 family)